MLKERERKKKKNTHLCLFTIVLPTSSSFAHALHTAQCCYLYFIF